MEIFSRADVMTELRNQIDEAGGLRAWSRENGVNAGYVSHVLRGEREPGKALLKPLGFRAETIYLSA
jgi:hypothetical protein